MKRGCPDHPKLYALAERLKVRRPTAIGILELLWHFTAKYAPRGDIGRYSDRRIEAAMDWRGKRGALIEALLKTGWLDRAPAEQLGRNEAGTPEQQASDKAGATELLLSVHDWADHADDAVRKRLARSNQHFAGKVTGQHPVTDRNFSGHRPENGSLPLPVPTPEPCLAGQRAAFDSTAPGSAQLVSPARAPRVSEIQQTVREETGRDLDLVMAKQIQEALGAATLADWRAELRRGRTRMNSNGLLPTLARDAREAHERGLVKAREMLASGKLGSADHAVIFEAFPELRPAEAREGPGTV